MKAGNASRTFLRANLLRKAALDFVRCTRGNPVNLIDDSSDASTSLPLETHCLPQLWPPSRLRAALALDQRGRSPLVVSALVVSALATSSRPGFVTWSLVENASRKRFIPRLAYG